MYQGKPVIKNDIKKVSKHKNRKQGTRQIIHFGNQSEITLTIFRIKIPDHKMNLLSQSLINIT